ncbi:class I SAM-dependent methyltransferase [Chloroflexota bacterium]
MRSDYTTITETPGIKASKEQLARFYQRYHFARQLCVGKDVLEVACGAGQGLGYIAKVAKKVVGGDIDKNNLKFAQQQYAERGNIKLQLLDAHKLPFEDKSFDVVILYEAIYYLVQPENFVDEARRILRKGGLLIICTVNKDWSDFNPSPYSTRYFAVPELHQMLNGKFLDVQFYGAFPATTDSLMDKFTSLIKRLAIALKIMPKTMKGKEVFKRIFFGRLSPLPVEIDSGMAEYYEPAPIPCNAPNFEYKVLFAVAHT